MYNKNYSGRKYVVIGIFILIALLFLGRLFYLQVSSNQYQLSARNIALRRIVVYPPRGRIYDRSHHLLVYNDAVYDLMVVPRQVKDMDTTKFCALLGITQSFFDQQMKKAEAYSYYKPSVFLKQLSKKEKGPIEEVMYEFPGFYFQTRTLRHYPLPIAANVLGNVGEVNNNDLKDHFYSPGDYIGKSGIEKYYEKQLRGKKGSRIVKVNVHNIVKGSFQNGKFDTLAIQGKDITLGLDAKLQELGQRLMANKKGSIVALDPKTGEILAMVSSPSYDPSLLVGRARSKNYLRLLHDTLKPLMNRAVLGTYPPGSTFKPVNALIALQDGVITANTMFTCQGPKSKPIPCDEYHVSPLDMETAIAVSCNSYFWKTFKRIMDNPRFPDMHDAFVNWYNKVRSFGFGQTFKTDIPFEQPGNIPSKRYFDRLYRGSWNALTVRSLSIGQGEILATPIQMANEAAILANRGYYIAPHFIESIGKDDTLPARFTKKHYVAVQNPLYYKEVIKGMEKVFSFYEGTARFYKMDSISQAGKTGTAQNPHGKAHALFIEFAPVEHPKIAIAVIVENAGYGTVWAAPIASLMVEKYLTGKIKRKKLEERMLKADLIHDPNP